MDQNQHTSSLMSIPHLSCLDWLAEGWFTRRRRAPGVGPGGRHCGCRAVDQGASRRAEGVVNPPPIVTARTGTQNTLARVGRRRCVGGGDEERPQLLRVPAVGAH